MNSVKLVKEKDEKIVSLDLDWQVFLFSSIAVSKKKSFDLLQTFLIADILNFLVGFKYIEVFIDIVNYPSYRGDGVLSLLTKVIILVGTFLWFFVSKYFLAIKYNEVYIQSLLDKGYRPTDSDIASVLRVKGFTL